MTYILKEEHKQGWLLIGKSGTGKSSFISLFSTKSPQLIDDFEGCPIDIHIYDHKVYHDIKLIDTRGFHDDQEAFRNILTALNSRSITKIKIVWCIDPAIKENENIKNQAKFIQRFNKDIWKSTILIVKKGDPYDNLEQQDAINAAILYGDDEQNLNKCCLKYSCLEWLTYEKREKYNKRDKQFCHEDGIYTKNEIIELIDGCINNKINQYCEIKCNNIGMDKSIEGKYHFNMKFSNENLTQYEIVKYKYKHPGEFKIFHNGIHSNYHNGYWKPYHRGKLVDAKKANFLSGCGHVLTLGISTLVQEIKAAIDGGQAVFYKEWSCCKQYKNKSSGCSFHWSCCGNLSKNHIGCKEKWSCCQQDQQSLVCKQKWSCCGNSKKTSQGCHRLCLNYNNI